MRHYKINNKLSISELKLSSRFLYHTTLKRGFIVDQINRTLFLKVFFVALICTLSFYTKALPPPNDNCSNAIVLPSNNINSCSPVSYSMNGATVSPNNAPCSGGGIPDVWFTVTTTSNNKFFITTGAFSPGDDFFMEIYSDGCSTSNSVACEALVANSTTVIPQGAGTYTIRIESFNSGNFELCVWQPEESTWTGITDNNWNTASNWSSGVPLATTDVIIPDVTNDPTISSASVARSIIVKIGGTLTISGASSLSINNSTDQAVYNQGSLINHGTLNLGQSTSIGDYGIINLGTLTNNSGGIIKIDRSTQTALSNEDGTVNNFGQIIIGSNTIVGNYGIATTNLFNNQSGGVISIDNTTNSGIYHSYGNFHNYGTLNIGSNSSVGNYGISNNNWFYNESGGIININRTTTAAIYENFSFTNFANSTLNIGNIAGVGPYGIFLEVGNFFNGGDLGNAGTININNSTHSGIYMSTDTWNVNDGTINIGSNSNIGQYGIYELSGSSIYNHPGAVLNINRSSSAAIYQSQYVSNEGTINIGNLNMSAGNYGIHTKTSTYFDNKSTGVINIERTTDRGIFVESGLFRNYGLINAGSIANIGKHAIRNQAIFTNFAGGNIFLDRATDQALFNNGTFNNNANVKVGTIASSGTYGVANQGTFNNNSGSFIQIDRTTTGALFSQTPFNNSGNITLGSINSIGNYGVMNYAAFNHNSGDIVIDRATTAGIYNNNVSSFTGVFTNKANVIIGQNVSIPTLISGTGSGNFINSTGGILKGTGNISASNFSNSNGTLTPGYSPGKMTFTASESFTNSTMNIEVVSGGGVGGTDFDQLVVTGTATLGSTTFLTLNFSYPVPNGKTFDILTATSVSGTIPTGNISFTNSGSGNVTGVTISYPGGNIVRVTAASPLPIELVNLNAEVKNRESLLSWSTSTESNNAYFDIEHRSDRSEFETIGKVEGHGTTTEEHNYQFIHEHPVPGNNYYRLKQVDFDGSYTYSPVVHVLYEEKNKPVIVNPVHDRLIIKMYDGEEVQSVLIHSLSGALLMDSYGLSEVDVSQFPSGLYLVQVITDGGGYTERVVKE